MALKTTSACGRKRSRSLILGICLGYALVQTICIEALYQLNHFFAPALNGLRIIGGIYMIWLAIHIFRSQPDGDTERKNPTLTEGQPLAEGQLLQLVNVKIYFYITSLLSGYFIPNCDTIFELALVGAFADSIG